jgi:ribonucleoside-diphosphate reductase alpha chain
MSKKTKVPTTTSAAEYTLSTHTISTETSDETKNHNKTTNSAKDKDVVVENGSTGSNEHKNGRSNSSALKNGKHTAETIFPPETIVKRDGRVVEFDIARIERAIARCFAGLGKEPHTPIADLAKQVVNIISAKKNQPTVESVQDIVEMVLQAAGEYEAAKKYILYRAEHAQQRKDRPIPEAVREKFAVSDQYFPTQLQKFQFFDKYSRFNYELGRRETWVETVDRAVRFLRELSEFRLPTEMYDQIRKGMLEMRAMPSMRLLAMAGPAARRNNVTIYNCSYMPVDSIDSFVEALIISMCGCGVGFSVERRYVESFPRIQRQKDKPKNKVVIEDSAEGWADVLRTALHTWFSGEDIEFDYSQLRLAGAPLRVKGGRASGPEPLRKMLEFVRARILARQGDFLRTLDAHDIMCAVGNAAVSGGVRRTAMLSLFDFDDTDMRFCKSGDFERHNSQRWNANNSAVWPSRPLSQAEVAHFGLDMVNSGRGEPGIFSRQAAVNTRPERRKIAEFGTNPCGEIILRPFEFCNLSIAIARQDDTFESLREKVELATIIGTIQSMATFFPGLRPQWKQNCEEERLLGVDVTGQMDSPVAQDAEAQEMLRRIAVETNRQVAKQLSINQSAAVTCVKPSGNSSQLFNCSPGIHARWAPYYVRNVRVGTHTPIFKVLRDAGVPMDPENGQMPETANTWVIHFPVKSPDGAITRKDVSALKQCEYWLQNKTRWTEHNPSVTITYQPDEVLDLVKWIWAHQDKIGGMAFLPAFDAQYDQMPYVCISKEEYERLAAEFPDVDFSKLFRYEEEDFTTAAQELACLAGNCDV